MGKYIYIFKCMCEQTEVEEMCVCIRGRVCPLQCRAEDRVSLCVLPQSLKPTDGEHNLNM